MTGGVKINRISVSVKPGKSNRYVVLHPPFEESPQLYIRVILKYPKLGEWDECFVCNGDTDWIPIWSARTPGWPGMLRHGAKVLSYCGWPHDPTIQWPIGNPQNILRTFAKHRAQDILGALSVLGRLSGGVLSCCAGHRTDVMLLQQEVAHVNELHSGIPTASWV